MPTPVIASAWFDSATGVEQCIQAAAIVVGGVWAYLKYGRGQPFISRAEIQIQATTLKLADRIAIRLEAEFRNVGACRTNLRESTAEVFGATRSSPRDQPIDWGEALLAVPILDNEEWVEAGETVRDQVLISVPDKDGTGDAYIAYQVKCDVLECGQASWYHSERLRSLRPPQPTYLHDQAVLAATIT